MTTMQFASKDCPGIKQQVLYDLSLVDQRQELTLDYALIQDPPHTKNTPLFAPVCTTNINYRDFNESAFNQSISKQISWLREFDSEHLPWSSYHLKNVTIQVYPGRKALMPLIGEKVNSLKCNIIV